MKYGVSATDSRLVDGNYPPVMWQLVCVTTFAFNISLSRHLYFARSIENFMADLSRFKTKD